MNNMNKTSESILVDVPLTGPVPLDVVRILEPGSDWEVKACDDWDREPPGDCGDHRWRVFKPHASFVPDEAGWAVLAAEARLLTPWATVVFGPRLDGYRDERIFADAQAERLPKLLLVTLDRRWPGPLSLLRHEALHEVWPGLLPEDRDALGRHGDALRQWSRDWGDVYERNWFSREEEAEAVAFSNWCAGGGDRSIAKLAEAIPVWERIRAGTASGPMRRGF